jgi:hypothetical protein
MILKEDAILPASNNIHILYIIRVSFGERALDVLSVLKKRRTKLISVKLFNLIF